MRFGSYFMAEYMEMIVVSGIAAAMFLWFLDENGALYAADGRKRIADNALVALTLMIAESRPQHKDTVVKVVVNLINRDN